PGDAERYGARRWLPALRVSRRHGRHLRHPHRLSRRRLMSFSLFQRSLLLPAEAALNALLALDPLTPLRLRPFEGQTLAVRGNEPSIELYISIRAGKLCLSPVSGASPNAALS